MPDLGTRFELVVALGDTARVFGWDAMPEWLCRHAAGVILINVTGAEAERLALLSAFSARGWKIDADATASARILSAQASRRQTLCVLRQGIAAPVDPTSFVAAPRWPQDADDSAILIPRPFEAWAQYAAAAGGGDAGQEVAPG